MLLNYESRYQDLVLYNYVKKVPEPSVTQLCGEQVYDLVLLNYVEIRYQDLVFLNYVESRYQDLVLLNYV